MQGQEVWTFQFLDGAIKTWMLILKAQPSLKFQFLDGAIKTHSTVNYLLIENNFNSSMVR